MLIFYSTILLFAFADENDQVAGQLQTMNEALQTITVLQVASSIVFIIVLGLFLWHIFTDRNLKNRLTTGLQNLQNPPGQGSLEGTAAAPAGNAYASPPGEPLNINPVNPGPPPGDLQPVENNPSGSERILAALADQLAAAAIPDYDRDPDKIPKIVEELLAAKTAVAQTLKEKEEELKEKIQQLEDTQQQYIEAQDNSDQYQQQAETFQQKQTEWENEISKLMEENETLELLQKYRQNYRQGLDYLVRQKNEEDLGRTQKAYERFLTWKPYVLQLSADMENELFYKFLEVLEEEKYGIDKGRRVLLIPISPRPKEHEENLERIKGVTKALTELSPDGANYANQFFSIPNAMHRGTEDLDYQVEFSKWPKEINVFLKFQLSGIVMQIKTLRLGMVKLNQVLNQVVVAESKVVPLKSKVKIDGLDAEDITDIALNGEWSKEEKEKRLNELLSEERLNEILQRDHQYALEAERVAESVEKAWFTFLKDYIFKIVNSLQRALDSYYAQVLEFNDKDQKAFLDEWSGLYNRLIDLFSRYLLERLQIESLNVKPEQVYNPHSHAPQATEPDPDKVNNQIKEVVEDGFKYEGTDRKIIIQKAKVIVVKNPE